MAASDEPERGSDPAEVAGGRTPGTAGPGQRFETVAVGSLPANTLRRFWMMLAHRHANIFNSAELPRSLDVSAPTVRRYLDSRRPRPSHATH